jgi:hypothetical protein
MNTSNSAYEMCARCEKDVSQLPSRLVPGPDDENHTDVICEQCYEKPRVSYTPSNIPLLFKLALASDSTYHFLTKVDVSQVKDILRFAEGKTWTFRDNIRAGMLKYIENKNAIDEGNEWLHADNTMWSSVCDEAYDECSSYRSCLRDCVAALTICAEWHQATGVKNY